MEVNNLENNNEIKLDNNLENNLQQENEQKSFFFNVHLFYIFIYFLLLNIFPML